MHLKIYKNILFFLCAAIASRSEAQHRISAVGNNQAEARQRLRTLPSMTPVTAGKGTALKQRLIAESYYDTSGAAMTLQDSTWYTYSGLRGSTFDQRTLYYEYNLGFTSSGSYKDFSMVDVMADTVCYQSTSGYASFLVRRFLPDNKIIFMERGTTVTPPYNNFIRVHNFFNTNGYPDKIFTYHRNAVTNVWDSSQIRKVTYNASGLILSDSTFERSPGTMAWELFAAMSYQHNAQGNLVQYMSSQRYGTTWINDFRITNQYDASGSKVMAFTLEYNYGNGLVNSYRDTFEYRGAQPGFNTWIQQGWDTASNSWVRLNKSERHYNNQALVDSDSYYQWIPLAGSWVKLNTEVYQYNTYNNPVKMTNYLVSGMVTGVRNYYYQQYNDPTGISNHKKINARIYPNPAESQLNVHLPDARNKQVFISITDISGRMIRSAQLQWANDAEQIDIAGLTTGAYFIHISTPDGDNRQVFLKK